MISRLLNFMLDLRDRQRINIALSKGIASRQARSIELAHPASWEFSGFSQNGEDGIIDVLRSQLKSQNRYCIEIGSADGIENNSAWLIFTAQYSGLLIDGNPALVKRAQRTVMRHSTGAQYRNLFVNNGEAIQQIKSIAWHTDPDLLSMDIDGNDYHIASALLSTGFRPKIVVVEYNSVFGPNRSVTIPYQENFVFRKAHPSHLYYGVSICAWKRLFASHNYQFITTDSKGVNAFFVDPACFNRNFLASVNGNPYTENLYQYRKTGISASQQYQLIQACPVIEV